VTSPSMSLSAPGYRPVGLLAAGHDLEDFPAEMGRDRRRCKGGLSGVRQESWPESWGVGRVEFAGLHAAVLVAGR
jgi:hypothetical protein